MLTVNSAPLLNRILLDANDTLISITSSNGSSHYFRVKIYIDDFLIDEQGWSKKSLFTANKVFRKLINPYYNFIFNPNFVTGVEQQIHLIKKIKLEVNEYSLSNDALSQSVILPEFFLIYNQNPVYFDDQVKLHFLQEDRIFSRISKKGKISIPFMVNANNETVNIVVKNDLNHVLHQITIPAFTGKKIFLYNLNLNSLNVLYEHLYAKLEITVGTNIISQIFRFFENPNFPVKELCYLNNFGFFQYAYFDGELILNTNYERKKVENQDNVQINYDVSETENYNLNTGNLLLDELKIVSEIANSLDIKINLNNVWKQIPSDLKRVNNFKDKVHNYSENLIFSVFKNQPILNNGISGVTITAQISIKNVITLQPFNGQFQIHFEADFIFTQLYSQVRASGNTNWSNPLLFSGVSSPQQRGVQAVGVPFEIRIYAFNGSTQVFSNIYLVN